ncbi:MAG TPA: type II toxin-antitoxin system VapC family toxin [Gaiella sp.]|nr:type II toxin-antitoxin system VapC family toxin [Gaiella sp.]
MIVVDASAVVDFLTGDELTRRAIRDELQAGAPVHAPDFLTLEVLSALARAVRRAAMSRAEQGAALEAHASLRIARHPSHPLWPRIADLTTRFSSYDAAYVALAEMLDAPLLTTDRRLARAVTTVEVVGLG